MTKYMILYDLERRGEDYEPLLNALRKLGALHVLYSKWVLRTNYTAVQLRDYLRQFIDAKDLLLVVELTGVAAWTSLFISDEQFKQAVAWWRIAAGDAILHPWWLSKLDIFG